MQPASERYFTARQAAAALGVSLPTLYAYVSRGLISARKEEGSRASLYDAHDVKTLLRRKRRGRDAEAVASDALNFGTPVLDSALTLIGGGKLYYRGQDATELAQRASLEDIARLLWPCGEAPFAADNLPPEGPTIRRAWLAVATLPAIERCLAMLPQIAAIDDGALAEDDASVRRAGVRLVRLLAAVVAAVPPSAEPVHEVLARAWKVEPRHAELLRAALVLCADHELNASAFTVRVVAASGVTVYGAAQAGLAALQGPRHGGATSRVVALLKTLAESRDVAAALRALVLSGERLPGFGHWLYPDEDPRARFLLDMMARLLPDSEAVRLVQRIAKAAEAATGKKPNVDFALGAVERVLGLPDKASLSLFLVGRSVGWMAHLLEQRQSANLIRPRARYTGPTPAALSVKSE
jgi:citrate synthase